MNKPTISFDTKDAIDKKRMGTICNIFAGGTPSTSVAEYWKNGTIDWIQSGLVQDCVIKKSDINTKITRAGLNNSSAKMIKPDSALLAITGATCGKAGYLEFDACANQSVMAFEPYEDCAKYIYYLLQKHKLDILRFQAGGAQAGLSKNSCEELSFEFSSITIQKRIASFLSNIDSLIEEKKNELEKTKQYKEAMLYKMFPKEGCKVPEIRFKGYSDDYKYYSVKQLTKFHKQGYYTTEQYVTKGTKIVRVSDVLNPKVSYETMPSILINEADYNAFKVEEGDFLLARSGSIGRYGIVDKIPENTRAVFGSFIIKFLFDKELVTNEYFGYCYECESFKNQLARITQGGGNININAENIKAVNICLPTVEEQIKVANFLANIDERITHQEKEITILENYKATLLEKMFA